MISASGACPPRCLRQDSTANMTPVRPLGESSATSSSSEDNQCTCSLLNGLNAGGRVQRPAEPILEGGTVGRVLTSEVAQVCSIVAA